MKVLTAHTHSNKGGFSWARPGERVQVAATFAHLYTKPNCGCSACYIGLETRKGATAAVIVESEMSHAELVQAFLDSNHDAGFTGFPTEQASALVDEMLDIAHDLPVGHVLEWCES